MSSPVLERLAAEADHAWALELDRLEPVERKLVIHLHVEDLKRATDALLYGRCGLRSVVAPRVGFYETERA